MSYLCLMSPSAAAVGDVRLTDVSGLFAVQFASDVSSKGFNSSRHKQIIHTRTGWNGLSARNGRS